jgi:hypothetical protein
LLRIYIGKEGSLHHPRLILLTPSVNRIKGIKIARQSIPIPFPILFAKSYGKPFGSYFLLRFSNKRETVQNFSSIHFCLL